MGLKQSIVVVNEYTVKNAGGGSRGGTPGDYVVRYMLRDGATEELAPVRFSDVDTYITRYMARHDATEILDSVPEIKEDFREIQGLGGVAFGSMGKLDRGDISMSDRKVRETSKRIQDAFDQGKTVLKTVLSFDDDYLKEMGVVDKRFRLQSAGDYKGQIDQMKLRKGILDGMEKMGRSFDDLEWIGVLQVDTKHVHAHLAMVDHGVGNIAKDGTQKGKLSQRQMGLLRRGIDDSLDALSPVRQLSSEITDDRRNVRCYIKKFTHETMVEHGLPQFLLSTLPDDKRLWRASTNRKEMKKSNAIVREFVEEVLDMPDSGYDQALRDIDRYAKRRMEREDLNEKDYRALIDNGRERVVTDCMNGVYQVLKDIPDEQMPVRTPMLDAMSLSYDMMADKKLRESDPMVEFGFKLRSYSTRKNHHQKEKHKYRKERLAYEKSEKEGKVAPESKPLYDFYQIEEEYHAMLLAKYQHFLFFIPRRDLYEEEFEELMEYKDRLRRFDLMMNDSSLRRMEEQSAEQYGIDMYDLRGGQYVKKNPTLLDIRREKMNETYQQKEDAFRLKLEDHGLNLVEEDGQSKVKQEIKYDFDDVKALDLHHLTYDFPYDIPISLVNLDEFKKMANKRYHAYQGAAKYLEASGQGDFVPKLISVKDIEVMKEMADSFDTDHPVMKYVPPVGGGRTRKAGTIRLDYDCSENMKLAVKATVQSVQAGD